MKNIIILGANEGIGYWLAKQLLEDGYNVGILDICLNNLDTLKEQYGERLFVMKCDAKVSEEIDTAVSAYVEKYKKVDIAIHNACKCTFHSMEETREEVYKDVFDVNYFGALRLTRCITPYMKGRGGKIIFTSSGVGVMGFTKISPYASSKGAIEAFAKCMNIEYKKDNISFHIIHPPLTNTNSAPTICPSFTWISPRTVSIPRARPVFPAVQVRPLCIPFFPCSRAWWLPSSASPPRRSGSPCLTPRARIPAACS